MLVTHVDLLRCPNAHAETWLVAQIGEIVDRDIVTGVLGCPECMAEYLVRDGVVFFGDPAALPPREHFQPPREEQAMRLAAALDLTEARMIAVLHGRWGAHALVVRGLSPAQLLLVNPPQGIASGDGVSIVVGRAPRFASASASSAAFDETADAGIVAALRTAVRGGGRMLGPVAVPVPADLAELARDDEVWVAEAPAGTISQPVALRGRHG